MIDFESPTRRDLLAMIGKAGGAAVMYQAMTALAYAADSGFMAPPVLSGARKGASVLVLGAGLAGMVAAYELAKAGYKVQILEYQDRPGGRNMTIRRGDKVTEIDGTEQTCNFAPDNYFNPGPWRIPHHHRSLLYYCKQFGVELEPFIQLNHNAFVHNSDAFANKPQRYRELAVDFKGHVAELLGKALNAGSLDQQVTKEDKEKLLEAMREWGVLDDGMAYASSLKVSNARGFDRPPGGGVGGAPSPSTINGLSDVLAANVWTQIGFFQSYTMQTTMFQPKGGMDMIGKAFARQVGQAIRYNTRVSQVTQDSDRVTASWTDTITGATGQTTADWCVCTIPLPVLSQLDLQVGPKLKAAINAVPYAGQIKIGLEFQRRFWEQDDDIYGGHSFTDQAIGLISYPNDRFFKDGPAVLLGSFATGVGALQLTGMTPAQRIEAALAQGSVFHPQQYRKEYTSGVSFPWSRIPWIMGCSSRWTEQSREAHYQDMVAIDGRFVLAGEHASYYGAWMEGSLLSSLDAITRLHQKALAA